MKTLKLLLPIVVLLAGADAACGQDPRSPIAKPDLVFKEVDGIVAVEAEHFVGQHKVDARAWYRVEENRIPQVKPDPDGPHLKGASGGCYLEALPDTRATHDDKLVPGENYFAKPGDAGVLTYQVQFDNPGRYYVWVRHLSTGSEDNGLHVGLNTQWPESGQRWQTIKKRKWSWECRQRTKEVHVGIPMQLYLDIDKPGGHYIHFSIREDGFEFDKFVLASSRDFEPEGMGPEPVVHAGKAPDPKELSSDYEDDGAKANQSRKSKKTSAKKADRKIQPPAGRIAIVADGNSPDPDDIGATAVMFGLFEATDLRDRLVHLSHSCDLKPAKRISAADERRRQKVLGQLCTEGIDKFGPFRNLADFFNCRTQRQAAVDDLRDAIHDSTNDDPLWIIEAGEPDIIGYALQAAEPSKRKHVHVVSHHPANDNAGDFFKWQQILDFGVTEHQIGDQNVGLKTEISPWDWLKDHPDPRMQWIHKQFAYAEQDGVVKFQTGKFDCSDAGMVYWWITGADKGGNKHATAADIKAMLVAEGTR